MHLSLNRDHQLETRWMSYLGVPLVLLMPLCFGFLHSHCFAFNILRLCSQPFQSHRWLFKDRQGPSGSFIYMSLLLLYNNSQVCATALKECQCLIFMFLPQAQSCQTKSPQAQPGPSRWRSNRTQVGQADLKNILTVCCFVYTMSEYDEVYQSE